MHHIAYIRKRSYVAILDNVSYQKIMRLRNRKQIPLGEHCHMYLVHKGKYNGPSLKSLAPKTKLIDNRVLHVESFVHKAGEHHAKKLGTKRLKRNQSSQSK